MTLFIYNELIVCDLNLKWQRDASLKIVSFITNHIVCLKRIICLLSIAVAMFPGSVTSQTAGQAAAIRGPANPARAPEAAPPLGESFPLSNEQLQIQQKPGERLQAETAKIKFKLTRIKIKNPIIFTEAELIAPYRNKIGKMVSLGEIQDMANKMTERYQKAGYVLTQVVLPQQKITDGVVTLQVISGYVDKVSVSGDICPELKEVLQYYGCLLQSCQPLKMKVLERYTLLANDIPGMTVRAVLKASKSELGATDLTWVASQTSGSASATVNNFGSPYLGPVQWIFTGEKNSWYEAGDLTQIQLVSTASRELNYGQARHSEMIGCDGMRASILGQIVRARPGSILNPLQVHGHDQVIAGDFFYPWVRTREENLFLTGGLMIQNDNSFVLGTLFYNDRIRPLYGTIFYSILDSAKGLNQISLTLTRGLRILKASGATQVSRAGGSSGYTKAYATASRNQTLPCQFSLMMTVLAQYACDPLLAAAQFGFGGPIIGRGYDPSEILGDNGVAASIEGRYDALELPNFLESAQYYAFYDAGRIWNFYAFPPPQSASAMSTGLGVRFSFTPWARANFYLAQPLTRKVVSLNGRPMRFYFAITISM